MTWQFSPNVLMTIAGAMISIALVVVIWKYRHRIRAMISKAKAGSAPANIIPLARDMVVENMSDAVIMLDQQNRIMDLNIAARSIIDQDGSQPIGQYMDKVWAAWPVDMTLPLGKVEIVKEVSIKSSTGYQYYDLRISPLNDQQGLLAGRLVVLRDITRQKRAEETLRRRDETLEAIGFAAEQFLKKVAWEESIQEVLARLGEATRVSRIYLFENEGGLAGKPLTSYRYEWVTWGLASQLKDESLQNIDLMERGLSRWVEVLGRGQTINECVRDLPEGEKVLLESRGVHSVAIVPIFLDKTWWGGLEFDDCANERVWTSVEIDVLRAAANTIGAAIQRKRAEAEVRHWAEVISTLLDLTEIIGSTLDIPQVLTRLIMAADVLLPAERVVLFLWDEQQNVLAPYRPQTNHQAQQPLSFELYENFPRLYLSPAEIPLIQELQSKMEAIAVAEASKSPLLPQEVVNTYHVRSFLAVPIVFRDRFTGALYADYTTSSHTFSKVETDLAMALARQAALAIERARLFEASEQRFQEAETLRQAGAIVTSTIQEDEAIKLIMEQLAHVVPCDSASVQLIREGALEIVGGYGWLEPEQVIGIRFPVPGDNPNTIVVQEGKPYILENAPEQYPAFKEDPHNRILSWLGVPLVVHDQVIGILAMDSHQYSYFTPNHVRLVTAFAGQVAIVIENARLYAAEKIRVQQLDALRATAADILAELEPSRLIQTMLERAVSLLGATAGELGKYLEQTDELEIVASHQMGIDSTGMHMAMGEGVMGRSAELLQPLVVNNYKDWEGRSPQYAHTAWQTVMASPLLAHGKLVGVIAIMDTDANRKYGRSELQLLTLFAQQAAIAVENARLYQEARQAAERRAILHQVSQEVVTKGSDREKICQAVHHAASRLMQVEAFAITLLDKEHNEVEGIYLVDKDGRHDTMRIPADQGLSGKVISTGKSLSIGDFAKEMNANVVHFGSPEHTRSILAVPLLLGDRILGMVTAQTYQPYAYTNEDLNLLEMLAANAAFAIENARLFEEIQWLAITDPLTELYNRRGFFELGEREVERFRRFGRPLSAIMLDIDHFKAVNDTYGHSIGNQVLVGLAKSLKKNIREIDIIGRYGGEEIVIVLPETHLEGGILVAERLRRIVESTPFSTDRGMVGVTVSEGVAEFMENIPDLAILLDQADSAMYAAKQGGRNQVRAYPVK